MHKQRYSYKQQIKQKAQSRNTYYRASSPSPLHNPFQNIQNNHSTYMNRQFNTRIITVWVSQDIFYLQPKQNTSCIPTILKVNRKLQSITQLTMQQYKQDKHIEQKRRKQKMSDNQKKYVPMQAMHFSFFIGIIDLYEANMQSCTSTPQAQSPIKNLKITSKQSIKNKKVLVLAETVQLVCTINLRNIYKILKPIFIFYNPKHKENLTQNQAMLLLNLGEIFQKGMYYSYNYNLTLPLRSIDNQNREDKKVEFQLKSFEKTPQKQKQQENMTKDSLTLKQFEEQHRQFNWADKLQQQLINFNKNWSTPVIQGFVNKIQVYVNAQKFKIVLISRRSRLNGGPLQYATGFTKNGQLQINQTKPYNNLKDSKIKYCKNVGNYVQTQLIFHVKSLYFSFIQVRGTVPLHWHYKYHYGVPSTISITQSIQTNYTDFLNHIQSIKKGHGYQNVILLNLLQKNLINTQRKLIQNYEYIVKKCQKQPGIYYTYFDIHQRCQNKNYRQFNKFINNQLKQIIQACGFSVFQHKPFLRIQKICSQKSIIRTNCGTCIDRTNIAQSRIAAWQIVQIMRLLNIKITNIDQSLEFIEDQSPFAKLYRTLWADNGDAISQQYAGTQSMQSSTIRAGKISYLATIDHGLTSLLRAVRNVTEQDLGKSKAVLFLSLISKTNINLKDSYFSKTQQNQNSAERLNLNI